MGAEGGPRLVTRQQPKKPTSQQQAAWTGGISCTHFDKQQAAATASCIPAHRLLSRRLSRGARRTTRRLASPIGNQMATPARDKNTADVLSSWVLRQQAGFAHELGHACKHIMQHAGSDPRLQQASALVAPDASMPVGVSQRLRHLMPCQHASWGQAQRRGCRVEMPGRCSPLRLAFSISALICCSARRSAHCRSSAAGRQTEACGGSERGRLVAAAKRPHRLPGHPGCTATEVQRPTPFPGMPTLTLERCEAGGRLAQRLHKVECGAKRCLPPPRAAGRAEQLRCRRCRGSAVHAAAGAGARPGCLLAGLHHTRTAALPCSGAAQQQG